MFRDVRLSFVKEYYIFSYSAFQSYADLVDLEMWRNYQIIMQRMWVYLPSMWDLSCKKRLTAYKLIKCNDYFSSRVCCCRALLCV